MTTIVLPLAMSGAAARLVIAVAVGGAIALVAALGTRPPPRSIVDARHTVPGPLHRWCRDRRAIAGRRVSRRRPGRASAMPAIRRRRHGRASARPAIRRRPDRTSPDVVAAWCDDLARRCRSGSTLADAIVGSSPSSSELRRIADGVATDVERGASVRAALDAADRPSDPAVHLAVRVMAACARVGGPVARPLDRAAATLRLRHADELDRAAQSAQARLSAQVLTAVPLGALALLATLDPEVRGVITSPLGIVLVAMGSTASALGWWWMRRIVNGSMP